MSDGCTLLGPRLHLSDVSASRSPTEISSKLPSSDDIYVNISWLFIPENREEHKRPVLQPAIMFHRFQATCLKGVCLQCEESDASLDSKESERSQQPFFTFGVIADIQYADKNDAVNMWKTAMRYYRNSHHLLQSAIEQWNDEVCQPSFILQLGDIIDGFNAKYRTSQGSLEKILNEIDKSKAPFHHVWGNHEFYNFDRDVLANSKLNTKCLEDKTVLGSGTTANHDPMQFYAYHFSPFPKFRFIIVDTYDLSVLGRDKTSQKYLESVDFIMQQEEPEKPSESQGGLTHYILEFNGGFSKDQLDWLNKVLTFSDRNKEKVVIAGHVPIHPGAKHGHCLAWNYKAILSVLHSHKCVVCYIAGHDHSGGYCLDTNGIHHVTLEGIIESPPTSHAFGTVYVYDSKMVLKGRGRTPSREMPYKTF